MGVHFPHYTSKLNIVYYYQYFCKSHLHIILISWFTCNFLLFSNSLSTYDHNTIRVYGKYQNSIRAIPNSLHVRDISLEHMNHHILLPPCGISTMPNSSAMQDWLTYVLCQLYPVMRVFSQTFLAIRVLSQTFSRHARYSFERT